MSTTNINIVKAERENDNSCLHPRDILEETLRKIDEGEITPSALVILTLDTESDKANPIQYDAGYFLANISVSEAVGFVSFIKHCFLRHMWGDE